MRSVTCGSWVLACLLAAPLGARADEASENVVARYREALALEAAGERVRAAEVYAQVLRLDPEHRAARRALGYVRVNGEWLTGEALRRARELTTAASAQGPATEAPAPRCDAVQSPSDARAAALRCRALGHADARERAAAVLELKALALPGTQASFVRALKSTDSTTRVRAADALGLLGDSTVVAVLISSWEGRSGTGPRGNFVQSTQRSYIQDFDVEVAATSFIADPIVGVLQGGVVLDTRVLSSVQTIETPERLAYQGALARLVGTDLGPKVEAWVRWQREHAKAAGPVPEEESSPGR